MTDTQLTTMVERLTGDLRASLPACEHYRLLLLVAAERVLAERHGTAQPPTIH